jgi:hypothetical protein
MRDKMAHEGSTGLLFPIKQMKNNVVFLESSKVVVGDTDALIPIMLDPNNQISFKSGHCRLGDLVVILPAWGKKDQFLAIKGWGAYEVAAESLVIFNKMDWTYDGYPGRCTTYASGYIWKERFYWSTIPPIPNGYPTYFKLQVMRKGLNGHPDTLIANWPQNCSDGTAVYEDDINVAYGNTTPYIAEDYPLAYGADYMHYFYTAFPKRDNICAVIIPELGSNYWIDDGFCPAYVEPPEENPNGIGAIQRTDTEVTESSIDDQQAALTALLEELSTFQGTPEELEAFLQEIQDATDALYGAIENYEIEEGEAWINEAKLYWTPCSNDILIRYHKTDSPPTVVPDPVNLEEGIIPGHGDLLYFGPGTDGVYIHEELDWLTDYTYTIWNVETRLDEDGDSLYVYNQYESGYGQNYPRTDPVYATVFINAPDAVNLISNSTFDTNGSGWALDNVTWGSQRLNFPVGTFGVAEPGSAYSFISYDCSKTHTFYASGNLGSGSYNFLTFYFQGSTGTKAIRFYQQTGVDGNDPLGNGESFYIRYNVYFPTLSGMSFEEIWNTYKRPTWDDYSEYTFTAFDMVFHGYSPGYLDNVYLWEHVSNKCDISGNPI